MEAPLISDLVFPTIPAGESRELGASPGMNVYYVLDCSHSRFSVQINNGTKLRGRLARGWSFRPGFSVEKVRIWNEDTTGLPLQITVQLGDGEPLDNNFNVDMDEIVPILRSDTPFIVGEAKATAGTEMAVDVWVKLLDADEFRSEVWLKSDAAAGESFWNTSDPGAPAEFFSRDVVATAEAGGFLKLKTTAAIWVRVKVAAKTVRALAFKFAE